MKKNTFSYSRVAAAILIISAITISVAWLTPAFAGDKKDRSAPVSNTEKVSTPAPAGYQVPVVNVNDHGENQLVQSLLKDRVVDEIKGFTVERKENRLFIDGVEVSAGMAGKYLAPITQEFIRVQVSPFMERLKRHPDADLLQLIAPVSFSSGCVDYTPKKKEGC